MDDTPARKRRHGGRAANTARRSQELFPQMPWRLPVNTDRPTEPLREEGVLAIHDGAMRILEEIGIELMSPAARAALRAVGEPTRGKPVSELSVGQMLDSLFAITRDFDMQTQPHLLLLQKTMVMVEGIATSLNPSINMWDVAAPYVGEWIRGELGPEAMLADGLRKQADTLKMIPDLIRRLDEQLPRKGGAPEPPPLPTVQLIWERKGKSNAGRYILVAALAGALGAAGMWAMGLS